MRMFGGHGLGVAGDASVIDGLVGGLVGAGFDLTTSVPASGVASLSWTRTLVGEVAASASETGGRAGEAGEVGGEAGEAGGEAGAAGAAVRRSRLATRMPKRSRAQPACRCASRAQRSDAFL